MMPEDGLSRIAGHDAIFLGAIGWPNVPDPVSLWTLLMPIRRDFQQYANVRPVRLFDGVPSPLAGKKPGDIDMLIIRENNEGEYSEIGGRLHKGTDHEMALQESVFTRFGIDRIMRYAFARAAERPRKSVTAATKSNGIIHTMPFWDERFRAISAENPGIATAQYHIDILAAHFVLRPERFDVVVASNLFGDILSDLGPAVAGTIGIAPSGNINPERRFPSMFEPVHGSAPDIAGQEHRQSDRPDLVGGDDARSSRLWRRRQGHRRRDRAGARHPLGDDARHGRHGIDAKRRRGDRFGALRPRRVVVMMGRAREGARPRREEQDGGDPVHRHPFPPAHA